jgi:GAF domain-containing protein
MHIRALLAIPIRREPHDYGLLCLVQTDRPRLWTTSEISTVKTAADIIMSAYLRLNLEVGLRENMQVLTEYDDSLQDLLAQKEMLAAAAQDFLRGGTHRFAESAHRTLKSIGQLLEADGVGILISTGKEDMDNFEWRKEGLPCRAGYDRSGFEAALQSAAASLRTPVVIDDMMEMQPESDLVRLGQEEGLRSLLVIPCCRQDGLTGVITCYKAVGLKYWHRADISSAEAFLDIFLDAYRLRVQDETCDAPHVLLGS